MKLLILTIWQIVLFLLSVQVWSQGDSARLIVPVVQDMSAIPGIAPGEKRHCACEVVEVDAGSYEIQTLVLLAESSGGSRRDLKFLRWLIYKEKSFLQLVFAHSVRSVSRGKSDTDCITLFGNLKKANSNLRLYNILQADAYTQIVKR